MHPDAYAVLGARASAERRIKGSRFIARALPVSDAVAAAELRRRVAADFPDASHHCWAYRLGHPDTALLLNSDAGEPAGSAGAPIERAIVSSGLSDLICVVVRWFGGTKLGVGGLIRAYGGAAAEALAAAERAEKLRCLGYEGEFPYEMEGALRSLLDGLGGRLLASAYGERVSWRVELPASACAPWLAQVLDLARGRELFRAAPQGSSDESTR